MARRKFWSSTDAYLVDRVSGAPLPGATATCWTAKTGGTQITDLRVLTSAGADGGAIASGILVADADGFLPDFLGPNDGTYQLWIQSTAYTAGRKMMRADDEINAGDAASLLGADGNAYALTNLPALGHTHTQAELSTNSMFARICAAGVWPVRGTTAGVCMWIQTATTDPLPAIDGTYAKANVDILVRKT